MLASRLPKSAILFIESKQRINGDGCGFKGLYGSEKKERGTLSSGMGFFHDEIGILALGGSM